MADWYVYQHDGEYLGPWSTEVVADAILAGRLSPEAWIAAPGGPRWLRALDVPVIARLVDGLPTAPPRRDSGLRLLPLGFTPENGIRSLRGTVMMVKDAEIEIVEPSAPEAPATEPSLPPIATPTPAPVRGDGGEPEPASSDRRRRRKRA